MSKRRRQVEEHAPPAPPCFSARLQWVEFLAAAAEEQRDDGHTGPLRFEAGKAVGINKAWNFCADCDSTYRRAMSAAKKCVPNWLKLNVPTLTDVVEPTREDTKPGALA